MKRFRLSNRIFVAAVCTALVAFAVFVSTSAANLNYSTLQGIDGPITARQIEALRLSSVLSATSVGLIVGVTFVALSAITYHKSIMSITHEAGSSSRA